MNVNGAWHSRSGWLRLVGSRAEAETFSAPARGGRKRAIASVTATRQPPPMTSIALALDEKLKTLDAPAALSLEKLVRGALELAEVQNGHSSAPSARPLPADFFQQIAAEFGGGPFERPPPREPEQREAW